MPILRLYSGTPGCRDARRLAFCASALGVRSLRLCQGVGGIGRDRESYRITRISLTAAVKIESIPVTQNGVRDRNQVHEMAAYARQGGVFDDARLIAYHTGSWPRQRITIACLEDGSRFFHDGHHRLLAIHLGGRDFLYEEEVDYFDITYAQYHEVNFETGWLTPYCVRTELRTPNVHEFKQHARALPPECAEPWIRANRHLYCVPRAGLNTVADLARYLGFYDEVMR